MTAISERAVVSRARIEMIAPGFHRQPYHAVEHLALAKAQEILVRSEASAISLAAAAIREATATLRVRAAAVLIGSGKPLPELAKILASHPLLHTAEGVFYRDVLIRACEACAIPVKAVKEKEVIALCARSLGFHVDEVQPHLLALGKPLGRPWTQDEKLATAAAISLL